jgi:hypothetical protein
MRRYRSLGARQRRWRSRWKPGEIAPGGSIFDPALYYLAMDGGDWVLPCVNGRKAPTHYAATSIR